MYTQYTILNQSFQVDFEYLFDCWRRGTADRLREPLYFAYWLCYIYYKKFNIFWCRLLYARGNREVKYGLGVYVIFFIVSFGASIIGAICGIGGGVIIKPVLDALGVLDVSTIGFLSGCTVLMMSCYSVVRSKLSGTSGIELGIGTPLAIGAAVGGVVGKSMYQWVASLFTDANTVGAVQAIALGIITVGTLIYTVKKDRIKTYHLRNKAVCLLIGFLLPELCLLFWVLAEALLILLFYFSFFRCLQRLRLKIHCILFYFLRRQAFCRRSLRAQCRMFPCFCCWEWLLQDCWAV